jgi:hypothetical protein
MQNSGGGYHSIKKSRKRPCRWSKSLVGAWSIQSIYHQQPIQAFTIPSKYTEFNRYKSYTGYSPKGTCQYRQRTSSLFVDVAATDDNQVDNDYDDDDWNVGNVYNDLDLLKREIAKSNAEQHLRQVEDRERLDTFAQNRHPLHRNVRRFVLLPLLLSIVLSIMTTSSSRFGILSRIFTGIFDFHFMVIMVAAPMLLLMAKRNSMPPPPPLPTELRGLDPEYYRFVVTDWQDPKTSCSNVVLCLLENWTSAVIGPAIALSCLLPFARKGKGIMLTMMAICQFITRLGAIAALHQYPKLLYQLRRFHQPRPLDRFTMRLQQLVGLALSLAPLGVASDLSKVWSQLPFKLVASFVSVGLIPYAKHRLIRGRRARPLTRQGAVFQSLAYSALTATQVAAVWVLIGIAKIAWKAQTVPVISYKVLAAAGISLSTLLAGPIGHLIAVCKLVRICYIHDISLSNDNGTISAILNDPIECQNRFKWRYRLEWREPERILVTLSEWKGAFLYWLLFDGGVEDQLRKEFQQNQKSAAYREGLTVLQRVQKEVEENPDAPRQDSTQWKTNAMEKIAAKHKADYESGKFEDPLGVAIQQSFGIGLGYKFDHMSKLKDGERPSARRIQARAAKSAIRRAQKIYDAQAARDALESIDNVEERELKKAELRRAVEAEIAYLASQLSELIPTDLVLENRERQTKIQQFKRYKKMSSHEMIVEGDTSSSLESLFGKTNDDEDETDEEFVEAWMKRQQNIDDEDDSTVLA